MLNLESIYFTESDLKSVGIGSVGKNVSVSSHAIIAGIENLHLGNDVRIDGGTVILATRGKLTVGSCVHIEPSSSLVCHSGITIGNFCTISHGVRLFTGSADYSGESLTNRFPAGGYQNPKFGPITLEDHVIVGGNSVIMPYVTLGEGAAIGALSLVRHSLAGWSIYGGNPLRELGKRKTAIRQIGESLLERPD